MTSKFALSREEAYRYAEALGMLGVPAERTPTFAESVQAFGRVIEWRNLPAMMDRIQIKLEHREPLTVRERALYPYLFS